MHPDTAHLEMLRRFRNVLLIGIIAAVDHDAARCRVQTGGNLTGWLPWITLRAGTTRTWCPPTVGEQVIIFSPSGEPAGGFVLGGIYSERVEAPSADSAAHVVEYPDGARIAYNHATGAMSITGIQSLTIDCPQITITGAITQAGGNLTSNGIVLHTHKHTGVQAGGSQTGTPV
jgi:phage baseplate assembly protein V